MKITQITFVAKNIKCLSVRPVRYLFNTVNTHDALEAANELLKNEKHCDKYKALPAFIIEVNDVYNL